MGGEGSGRRPDPVKKYVEQKVPLASFPVGDPIILPNYSGLKKEALKTDPTDLGATGSGSGTVSSGTAGQIAYYQSSGTQISGSSVITISGSTSTISGSIIVTGSIMNDSTGSFISGSQVVVGDHAAASTDMVVNICYGTSGTPPTASDTTEGTLYVQYTA